MSTIAIKSKLSVKTQIAATFIAIISAVVLPQIFHIMGYASGLGTALGEAFLPMHLPIILVGLLAGTYAGAVSGFLSPLVSFMLTDMPKIGLLPFMMIELCVYGLASGFLRNVKIPTISKVVIAQFTGRAVRAIAILTATYFFKSNAVPVSIIWSSILTGIFGLALQWSFLPLIVYRVESVKNNGQ